MKTPAMNGNNMKTFTIIIILLFVSRSLPANPISSHCAETEFTVFNCQAGAKIASVCASPTLSKGTGYLQYRFGPIKSPELIYPENKIAPDNTILANTLTFSGGGGAYLRFQRGRYGYVVYTAIGRGWGEKAGIAVEKDQRLIANLSCGSPVISELGPDFFDRAGLAADDAGFDLP
jgi:hypothetical protein